MDPIDFLKLLANSNGIVGNSSVGIRECSFLGVPCINIGDRQKKDLELQMYWMLVIIKMI